MDISPIFDESFFSLTLRLSLNRFRTQVAMTRDGSLPGLLAGLHFVLQVRYRPRKIPEKSCI